MATPGIHHWSNSCSHTPFWDLPFLRLWVCSVLWWPFCCSLLSKPSPVVLPSFQELSDTGTISIRRRSSLFLSQCTTQHFFEIITTTTTEHILKLYQYHHFNYLSLLIITLYWLIGKVKMSDEMICSILGWDFVAFFL